MWNVPPFLSRSLSARRMFFALLTTGCTALLLSGAMIGLVLADDPAQASPPPDSLAVAAPHLGDRGSYIVQHFERTGDGPFGPVGPAEPLYSFEWVWDGLMRNTTGDEVVAYEANLTEPGSGSRHVLFDAADGGLVGQVLSCSASIGGGGEMATDRLFESEETRKDWSRCVALSTGIDRPRYIDAAPCGLLTHLQGNEMGLAEPVALHDGCLGPTRRSVPPCLLFVAEGVEHIGGRDLVRFASVNHGGEDGVEACHPRAPAKQYLWFTTELPYPVQMAEEGWQDPDRLTVVRLDALVRGDTAMHPARDAAQGATLPDLRYKPRQPWGPDDSQVAHPFRLSEAYQMALEDPDDATLREFLAAHPEAFPQMSQYSEVDEDNGTRVEREWWLILQDREAFLSVQVHQTVRPVQDRLPVGELLPAVPHHETVYSIDYGGSVAGPAIDPADVPDLWPTVDSMMGQWRDWTGLRLNDGAPNRYTFRVFEGADGPQVELTVGRTIVASDRGDPLIDPIHTRTLILSGLSFDLAGHATTTWEGGSKWMRLTGSPTSKGTPVSDDRLATAGLDVALVETPLGRALAVGVGTVALGAGLVYLFWPSLKGALLVPFFTRVQRHDALKSPVRAELFGLIETDPGVHLQTLITRTGRAGGEVQHHLRLLRRVGLVVARTSGGYTCFFPAGQIDRRVMDALVLLKSDGARAVLRLALERPRSSGADLADATGLSRQAVSQHLTRLANGGLVAVQRQGKALRVETTDLGRVALQNLAT